MTAVIGHSGNDDGGIFALAVCGGDSIATACGPERLRCEAARRIAARAPSVQLSRIEPARRNRLGVAPTERRTMAANALGLA